MSDEPKFKVGDTFRRHHTNATSSYPWRQEGYESTVVRVYHDVVGDSWVEDVNGFEHAPGSLTLIAQPLPEPPFTPFDTEPRD